MDEQALSGGNMGGAVRVGSTVRKAVIVGKFKWGRQLRRATFVRFAATLSLGTDARQQ